MKRILDFLNKHSIVIAIFFAGTALRFYNLTKISLWHDEAFSALLIKYPWGEMMYRIGLDVHPPMYYIFLRVWHYIFGYSLFSLRAMSVAFGIATIIAVYILVKRFFGSTQAALIAASLIAFNPFQIQYVTEARMYTMGAFFAVLATYYLALALQATKNYYTQNNPILRPSITKVSLYYIAFTITASILTYTHYYLLFTVAGLGLAGILYCFIQFRFSIKKYLWLLFSRLGIAVLFIPWLKIFLFQFKQVGAGYWIPPINVWSIPSTIYDLFIHIGQPSKIVMIACTLLALYALWQVFKQYQQTEKWLIIIPFLAPFGGSLVFALLAAIRHQESSVYLVRYFLFASPFFLIIIALWLHRLKINAVKWLLLAGLLVLNTFAVFYYWQQLDVDQKPGMASLAQLINKNVEPGHKLYVASSFEFFNFKYYNHSSAKPLLFTNGSHVHDLPHFAGTAILAEDDLVLNFKEATKPGDTVWLIWTNGFGGSKPIVPSNWNQIDEHGFAEVRPYVGTWVVVTEYRVD